ncbi:DUF3850 domain-containing protein [Lysinibacillus sp. KU-BSD001]|uniref:ParB/RepB/Spo0J family partition protein n=1 Tax=Lysinibacillus sp. KU-BSD001 TaxID=3141328 RepID=UPI0036EFDFC6
MKFNLNQLMNDKSKEAGEKEGVVFKIEHISIDKLRLSEMNKYTVHDVAELKASIELMGLQQNLLVRKQVDYFEVISGHRRLKAMKELFDEGNEQFKKIPCKIIASTDDIQAELQLILANATARELSDYEKTYQASRLQELLKDLKRSGYKFTGRTREIVAQLMNVSSSQVARMESINKNLTSELKDEFSEGNINITTAYELSKLPEEQQQEAAEEHREGKSLTPAIAKEKRLESEQKEKRMTHELKIHPAPFEAVLKGLKTFEYRFNNRSYREGDILKLNEYDPDKMLYTGRAVEAKVTYLLEGGQFGIPEDYVLMSIKKIR